MAKKKSKRSRAPVGRPLTPRVLMELGAIRRLPPAPKDFRPDGQWTGTYRIWTCHGYGKSGNEDFGVLRIARSVGRGQTATLKVDRTLVTTGPLRHVTQAKIVCGPGPLGSPVAWEVVNRVIGPDGKVRNELGRVAKARIRNGLIEITTGGRTFSRPGSTRLVSDWGLFDAVQRLPLDARSVLEFDVLEGLDLLKKDHRLSYAGADTRPGAPTLHRFCQIGPGVLPYEYWLDEAHRLLVVVTGSRAYILDDPAEAAMQKGGRGNG